MFAREFRPLKRPRLGIPDYYPQDDKQREDELSFHTLNIGYRFPPLVDTQDEYGSAHKDFNQQLLNPKEYSHRVHQVVEEKKKRRWVQDSERRRFQVTKDSFFPVPLGRSRKEIALHWFQDLASAKPLSVLAKKVPVFNKKEEIFDNLCEKDVPISRAAWYIKMTAAYSSTMTDLKLNKKKQTADPSFDWTVSLTKYMQECVWRICNEPNHLSRQDSATGRHPSSSSSGQVHTPSEEGLAELTRWQYMVYLSSWLYQENLLDSHEFLRWLVERIEHIKSSDTKALQLYLPLVLKHLLDIGNCVALARPLVKYCCQRLAAFFELEQKLAKFQTQPPTTPLSSLTPSLKSHQESHAEGADDDSVFDSSVSIKREPNIKLEPGTKHSHGSDTKSGRKSSASSSSRDRKHTATTPAALADGEVPIITLKMEDEVASNETGMTPATYFHWCVHHQSLVLQLCSIIQTIAIRCPTAFVQTKFYIGRGLSVKDGGKVTKPLSMLPMGLTELPMPRTLGMELQKKLLPALVSAEQEIILRNKAAESNWSAVTVVDLQTTSEGSNVQQVLELLGTLDTHSFYTSRSFNPLTTLYHRISTVQRSSEQPLADEMLAMLLCQWAVSSHRSGYHRPLVAARILRQRQDQIMRGADWKDELDRAAMDETWDEFGDSSFNKVSDFPFPFQVVLVQFLDKRAPLPDDLSFPVKAADPFYHLLILFSELIHLNVFSYKTYLSMLIARGETKSPIIPYLPFAREDCEVVVEVSRKRPAQDPEPLHCSIPLPALKRPHIDTTDSTTMERSSQLAGIASGPPSPGGSFGTGLNFIDDFLSGDSGSLVFPPDMSDMDENKAIIQNRAQQLQMLTSETSRLVSPLGFSPSHTDTDVPSSPTTQTKSDPFNFSIMFADEEQCVDPTLNKHASRHLIFAAYFPISGLGFSKQDRNERAVVLCGVGKVRQKVEGIVKALSNDMEHYFRLVRELQTPMIPESELKELMIRFRALPTFEQQVLATSYEDVLRGSLSPKKPYPVCAQLVFVCELLKVCGGIHQMINLLVDIIACDFSSSGGIKEELRKGQPPPPPLPAELCLPIVCLLQKYVSCLLLSQNDTAVVFENLCRVLGLQKEITSAQKTVFFFLHRLYSNCLYLRTTFQSTFGSHCTQLGEYICDSFSPSATDADWQKTIFTSLSKPSECNIHKVCATIKSHHPKTHFCFAVEVFTTVCQKTATCQTLSDLAHVCGEVSCLCGLKIHRELMGVFRALVLPSHIFKSCHSGYSCISQRSNVLVDRSIHSNLITFVTLLLTNNCFNLQDIITYIIRPSFRTLFFAEPAQLSSLFEFINSLIRHLFISDYIEGVADVSGKTLPINFPLFVQHCLEAKCRDMSLGFMIMLLKDLAKFNQQNRSGGGGVNEAINSKIKMTLELLASQPWVRNQCMQQPMGRLLEYDMLGEKNLLPSTARYLLLLLCPYTITSSPSDLVRLDPASALEDILKNLDQWTFNNSLLHINMVIPQSPSSARMGLLEDLAAQVIHVFEDSCGDEWLGQTIECCVDRGDGSFSPSVWLVTPLISKLSESVLGRVLKSAGNVLGQGQWWNPEKNQEKRRATRATSGVVTPKTGLQWQQPFLELVLACMHAQSTTHEELLGPLKNQLSTFLSAFEKEGMPGDEQGKAMLYAALKLRLSLVGSMLGSICVSESTTLEWLHLLMQFICSGCVDRQTDSSELFTNTLDMICTLLHSLSSEFHTSLAGSGEEGKKSHTNCIKKLKAELSNSKSYCLAEIRQLFPLSQKTYTVTTVKPPSTISLTKVTSSNERIKGLRVQDVKEISPWEILEGVKNSGPLMLSWFGAVRMKRKPLRFEEQRHQVRFHTHQVQYQNYISGPHTVKLPSKEVVTDPQESTPPPDPLDKHPQLPDPAQTSGPNPTGAATVPGVTPGESGSAGVSSEQMPNPSFQRPGRGNMINPNARHPVPHVGGPMGQVRVQVPSQQQRMQQQQQQYYNYGGGRSLTQEQIRQQMAMKMRLNEIRKNNEIIQNTQHQMMPPMYSGTPGMSINYAGQAQMRRQQLQIMQNHHMMHQQRNRNVNMMQLQQQQQQHQMMRPQYGHFQNPSGMHMRPMQANPPMQMHQVMQQQQRQASYHPAAAGHNPAAMMPPGGMPPGAGQPGMQFTPQQGPAMNQVLHRPNMF